MIQRPPHRGVPGEIISPVASKATPALLAERFFQFCNDELAADSRLVSDFRRPERQQAGEIAVAVVGARLGANGADGADGALVEGRGGRD